MARRRSTSSTMEKEDSIPAVENEGESNMSEVTFTEQLTADEWAAEGGTGSAERGVYAQVLIYVRDSGVRFHRIPMDRGPFQGKKAASVGTALKQARDGKNAPEGVSGIKVSAKGANEEKGTKGTVYLENTAIEEDAA